MYFLILNTIFLLTLIHQSITSDWNYGEQGPDVWSDEYPLCAGHSQSPINIRTACTVYQSFIPFQFSSNYDQSQNFTLINDGHTISGTLTDNNSSLLTLTDGGLIGTYQFSSFHFHWGENYKSGSEHQVNNKKYSGEVHFIHYNPTTNQTAVLAIFLQSNKETNTSHMNKRKRNILNTNNSTLTEWEKYFLASQNLQEINDSILLNLDLASLLNTNLNRFWRYTGSLTTPPCTEGIVWSVFTQPVIVNDDQFRYFRNNLYSKDYRDPQPLYNRTVYRSFFNESLSSISDHNCCPGKDLNQLSVASIPSYCPSYLIFLVIFSFFIVF